MGVDEEACRLLTSRACEKRQKHAADLIVVQRYRERNCASAEKSELRDSFIRVTLLAEVGRPSNKRWPFDNIGKSTKVNSGADCQESRVESCP
jgi:hypothetical protein